MDIEIFPIISRSYDANAYLLIDETVALIDTGTGTGDEILNRINKKLGKRGVDLIINTHAHADHCGGNKLFPRAKVHIHRDDANELLSGRLYGTAQLFGIADRGSFHRLLEDGDKIELGELVLQVLHTPGHTHGSICLYARDEKFLFSGDTLFAGGNFGRTDMGGSEVLMVMSLNKLTKLDFETLYPGHGGVVGSGKEQAALALKNARELFRN